MIFQVISAVGTLAAIVFGIVSIVFSSMKHAEATREQTAEATKNAFEMQTGLKNIQTELRELRKDNKDHNAQYIALLERVGKCEESTKSAHKRIDRIDEIVAKGGA